MNNRRRKPTAKQAKFVREYLSGNTVQQAVRNAGYNVTDGSARVLGQRLLSIPHVRAEFNRLLDEKYPDLDKNIAQFVNSIFNTVKTVQHSVTCPKCKNEFVLDVDIPAIKTSDQIRMFEALAKVRGWNAPQRSASIHVNIDESFKLPEDK